MIRSRHPILSITTERTSTMSDTDTLVTPVTPGYIVIERDSDPDLVVKYHSGPVAVRAVDGDDFIDGLCEENCLDCYAVTEQANIDNLLARDDVEIITAPTISHN